MSAYDSFPGRPKRRTAGRYIALIVIVVAACAGWTLLWRYAANTAEQTLAGWRAREAQAGRIQTCQSQEIGGFPFRVEIRCAGAALELRGIQVPVVLRTASVLVAAQIYQPSLLISELTGPATLEEAGQPPSIAAHWTMAQMSLRGSPSAPERVSLVFDGARLDRAAAVPQTLLAAGRIEIHGRIAEGSVANDPAIEVVLRLGQASAPGLHSAAAAPMNADITAMLRGLRDFSPKPWPVRFRELQAASGRIEIGNARVQQGETIAVGSGAIGLNERGHLDGQLRLTVAGIEPLLNSLGVEQMAQSSPTVDRLAGALDRFAPGLGAVARKKIGENIGTGINLLGEQTTLEGRRAVSLPLRFSDGTVTLGPLPVAQIAPLF